MNEFIERDGNIIVNVSYIEAYIPYDLFSDAEFKSAIAYEFNDYICMIGIFNMRCFGDESDARESSKLRTFTYPNMINTYPDSHTKEKLSLIPGDEIQEYMVLKYYRGNIMMEADTKHDSINCERFIELLNKGKIPSTVPYDDLLSLWLKNLQINNVDAGVPALIFQVIISELCRDRNDPSKQFRKTIGKDPSIPHTNYFPANTNAVSAYSSVFAGLTFEKVAEKLTTSLNMSLEGKEQIKSPIEQVLSM